MFIHRNILLPFTFAAITVLTSACSYVTGSSVMENVRVNLTVPVVVRDVYTGDTLTIDSVETSEAYVGVVRLRNGRRHVLSFSTDSSVAYRTTDLKRNWWAVLNYFNFGLGCIVDQLLETNYHIEPESLSKFTFQSLTPEERTVIEDSLRQIEPYPIPRSLIKGRTKYVVSVWGGMGIAGTQAGFIPIPNVNNYGIGFAPFPYIQVFHDVGSMFTSQDDRHSLEKSILHDFVFRTFGLSVIEPRIGLFASWRYGTGDVTSNSLVNNNKTFLNKSQLTSYAFAFGVTGQWGRVEYRHTRVTSVANQPSSFDIPNIVNGLYWTLQVLL